MYITIIIILFLIIAYMYFSQRKERQKLQNEQIIKLSKEYENKKREEEEKYNNFLHKLEETKHSKEQEYNIFLQTVDEKIQLNQQLVLSREELVDEKIASYKKMQEQKAEQELKTYFENQRVKTEGEIKDLENTYQLRKEVLDGTLESLNSELNDLKMKRDAYVEALKAEEKRRQDRAFYTIVLSNEDKEDIAMLRSVVTKLNNSEALGRLIYDVYIKKPAQEMLLRVVGSTTYGGIYKITHMENGKSYIGRSVDVKKRLTEHLKGAFGISTIADQEIHRVMGRDGVDKFSYEVLEKVEKEKLNEREKYWIDFYQTQSYGYNQNKGG